ncbi:MAG: DMT family transporter, partial [Rhodobacteraceae bacterium]|nr:DMT family transporter [Paracoccaceae bacterium]
GEAELTLGHAAALVGATCSALAATIVRKTGRDERSVGLLIYPTLGTFALMGVALPFFYHPMEGLHLAMNALLAVLAFSAMLMMIEAYKRTEAALVAPMQYSQILWASLYGAMFFGEIPSLRVAFGAGIIILSGGFVLWRESRG